MLQETDRTDVLTNHSIKSLAVPARRLSARTSIALSGCLALLFLAIVPPLISLNRYQRRVATSMSQVLGRPVHLDRITLNLLPLPSFTLQNLIIDDAPDFGAEPLIRANTVSARLRVSSLWRRRIEFSRITFNDPSVNLVHLADGRWNLEGVLLQASHVDAAPTSQVNAGAAPRFPYIEATGARVNLKRGQEKTPFSLTDADFALWLPEPRQWRMRIGGKPARTDTNVSDTGTIQIEASLQRASALRDVPLTADATWSDAPLGATSRIFSGSDLGVRGRMNLSAHLRGPLAAVQTQLRVQIDGLHRSDFVPERAVALDLECAALATHVMHSLEDLRCSWPIPDTQHATIALTGNLPDILDLRSAEVQIGTPALPASVLLLWLRTLSARIPSDLTASGLFSGSVQYGQTAQRSWAGHADLDALVLSGGRLGQDDLTIDPLHLETASFLGSSAVTLQLAPAELFLGGRDPMILAGSATRDGYTLHLSGSAAIPRLLALAASVPQFGDGLVDALPRLRIATPTHLDLMAQRSWGGPQTWTDTTVHAPSPLTRRSARPREQARP